jgi:membrane protein DedA with SNARE-associated domain
MPLSPEFIQGLPYWGYPSMLLLMILEGPIATMSSAFLASLGYFNIFAVFALSVIGDIAGDVILYGIGYYGGRPILLKMEKWLKIKHSAVAKIEEKFQKDGAKIIFYVKATTGLVYITFTLAGAIKMRFSKFLKYSFYGGLVWSSFLVIIGYFFGFAAAKISAYIKYAGIIIFILAIAALISINLYKDRRTKKMMAKNNHPE